MRRSWSRSLALSCVLAATTVSADEDPEALVQKGIELRKSQHDAEALDVFRLAYVKLKTPRVLAQIGLAEQALGQWLEAEADLDAAIANTADPWIQKNGEPLRAAVETVRGHLAWVVVTANVAGAELWVNGRSAGKLPLARVRTVSGIAHLEVAASGYETARRSVNVGARAELKVDVVLVASSPTAVTPVVVHGPTERVVITPSPWTKVGVASLSVGVFSLGLGTFFGIRTVQRKHDRDAHCAPIGCDAEGVTADREARFSSTMSAVTLGIGVITTAAGVYFLVRGRSSEVRTAVGPTSASLSWSLSW